MDAHAYPVELAGIANFRELRIELCRHQALIRGPGAKGRGSNRNKKIRDQFELPKDMHPAELEDFLAAGRTPALPENEVAERFRDLEKPEGSRPPWDPLRLARLLEACQTATPRGRARASLQIERGPVGNIVKEWNGWRCQLCSALGVPATGFITRSGAPYVEAHHVIPVSSGRSGVLKAENIMTVCPNHHRELHYGRAVVIDEGDSFRLTVELGTASVPKAIGILEALGQTSADQRQNSYGAASS